MAMRSKQEIETELYQTSLQYRAQMQSVTEKMQKELDRVFPSGIESYPGLYLITISYDALDPMFILSKQDSSKAMARCGAYRQVKKYENLGDLIVAVHTMIVNYEKLSQAQHDHEQNEAQRRAKLIAENSTYGLGTGESLENPPAPYGWESV